MHHTKPVIGITMGDPAGVGPEIAVRTVILPEILEKCNPVIVGVSKVIQREIEKFTPDKSLVVVDKVEDCRFSPENINVFEIDVKGAEDVIYGTISPVAGEAAFQSIKKVIELALNKKIDATVTGPIHKKSINDAGHHFAGHTEIYAHFTNTKNYAMLLASDALKVIHVTTHVPLKKACEMLSVKKVLDKILLLDKGLRDIGIENPRIGVAGLNPHAGDEGLFGDEEIKYILPAVEKAKEQGLNVDGPIPSDTLFPKAIAGNYDGCVVMYHDQGHIPFKLIGFSWNKADKKMESVSGVNITLGLPIIRASVDHGTAFDIAGKGIASNAALIDAIHYAIRMSH